MLDTLAAARFVIRRCYMTRPCLQAPLEFTPHLAPSPISDRAAMATANATLYKDLTPPTAGESITMRDGGLEVPNEPIIPYIEGDGTGPDIWRASQHVFDSAVKKAYGGT